MLGVAILGCTGSIGASTLAVLARHPERYRVVALTAGRNRDALDALAREWKPSLTGLASDGRDRLLAAATHPDVDVVVNAVVGFAGLDATLAALEAGKRVALANKESLVAGGDLVLGAAKRGGGVLVPVDSEHSAVLQCLDRGGSHVARLILTASGGPFRTWDQDRVGRATVAEALCHPTWRMGRKITIDSATLANKALEIIEAHFLFGLGYDQLDVVVHPQSIVHALVEFVDGNVLSQMSFPSMELPILYALTWPERIMDAGPKRFDPVAASGLTFETVRHEAFPAFRLGVAAGRAGGTAPAVFNAANEVAVARFLEGALSFGGIAEMIDDVLSAHVPVPADTVEAVHDADRWARERAVSRAGSRS